MPFGFGGPGRRPSLSLVAPTAFRLDMCSKMRPRLEQRLRRYSQIAGIEPSSSTYFEYTDHQPRAVSRSVFMSRMSLASASICSKTSGCVPKRKLGFVPNPCARDAKCVAARAAEADGVTSGKPKKSLDMISSSDACDDSIGPMT